MIMSQSKTDRAE